MKNNEKIKWRGRRGVFISKCWIPMKSIILLNGLKTKYYVGSREIRRENTPVKIFRKPLENDPLEVLFNNKSN